MLQDELQPQSTSQSKDSADSENDDSDDESMAEEEDGAGEKKAKTASSRQNEKLYDVVGVLNNKLRKAEKKRRKKAIKSSAMGDDMEGDYNFKVDYVKGDSAMDDAGDEDGLARIPSKNRFEMPVEVDE